MSGSDEHRSLEDIDRYSMVAEYEEEILSAADLIDTSLEENLIKADHIVKRPVVITSVEAAVGTEIDSEDAHALAHMLLSLIGGSFPDTKENLQKAGGSKKLIKFLTKMSSKYGEESRMPNYHHYQGPNYWNDFDVDILKRGESEAIGMNIRLAISHDQVQEISTSLDSNLSLIYNLLMAQIQTTEEFGDEAAKQTDSESVYEIQEKVDELTSLIEQKQHTEGGINDPDEA